MFVTVESLPETGQNGIIYLVPTKKNDEGGWYKGTANAIYQNISFIDKYDPENVLILSGDHIYKMDYDKMLKFHKEKDADATIGVFNVRPPFNTVYLSASPSLLFGANL